jgi:hypothetical protein
LPRGREGELGAMSSRETTRLLSINRKQFPKQKKKETIREGEIYGISCDTPQIILIGGERGDHELPYFPLCVNIREKNYTSYIQERREYILYFLDQN